MLMKKILSEKVAWLPMVFLMLGLVGLSLLVSKSWGTTRSEKGVLEQRQKSLRLFNPERQKQITVESESVTVSLESTESCDDCPSRKSFTLAIRDKIHGTISTSIIRDDTAQVDEILLAKQTRAVVVGSVNGTLKSINIINTETGAVVDSFNCIYPSLSKDGHFLAFARSASEFSSPQDWSYVYSVYDLIAGPAKNRYRPSAPGNEQGDEEVGTVVYPGERSGNADQITNESDAHVLASEGLFWLDGSSLAFVDRSKKVNRLVIVDVSAGIEKAKISAKTLNIAKMVKPCGESAGAPENLINVTDITLSKRPKRSAHLTFQPMGQCLQQTEIDMSIQ